ncbi:hypothetical protein E0485_21585 [Paenibacillus albiflavus]|uniref:Uncharacterized protein n=1 Tax=Paenibacillus albiflavus TaxID=2545760 RepID=A0A4R4E0X4_9BACL|nr:hypothetical protein [Paenibacillus albiflavus]TCZ73016.1 hypothetical protein E0485_21585 [Paenibacillus albiflavus]
MPLRKWKMIITISIGLNILMGWYLFSKYQENNSIKKGIIIQYALGQQEALNELERALANQDDKEEFVKALTSAYGIIYHIEILTRSDNPMSKYVEFPKNINKINAPLQSMSVGTSLFDDAMDRLNVKWIQELEKYTSYISQVVTKLDFQNRINGKSLNEQYHVLNEVSDLIDEFKLHK